MLYFMILVALLQVYMIIGINHLHRHLIDVEDALEGNTKNFWGDK